MLSETQVENVDAIIVLRVPENPLIMYLQAIIISPSFLSTDRHTYNILLQYDFFLLYKVWVVRAPYRLDD
jgi:hypothetical protein